MSTLRTVHFYLFGLLSFSSLTVHFSESSVVYFVSTRHAPEFETFEVSLVSRIRSPKPSQSKVVKSTTEKLANENREKVATNEQSEGVLTETEDIDIESSTAARIGVEIFVPETCACIQVLKCRMQTICLKALLVTRNFDFNFSREKPSPGWSKSNNFIPTMNKKIKLAIVVLIDTVLIIVNTKWVTVHLICLI